MLYTAKFINGQSLNGEVGMQQWLRELDRILRGEATRPADLRQGRIDVPVGGLVVVLVVLGLVYGACLGTFALFNRDRPEYLQLLATMLKVPALFVLTLLVTMPSLYVFNALVGSRLAFRTMLQLLIAAMAVMLAVLASFGPIVAFFAVTTPSYPFISLLNVLVFTVAGVLGLAFLLQTLHRLSVGSAEEPLPVVPVAGETGDADPSPAAGASSPDPAGALDRLRGHVLGRHVKTVFGCWIVVFALVGAQMGWVLRPFIGDPRLPFTWFRQRESSFFEAVMRIVRDLFS
jgi:hypothetical protein